MLVPAIVTVAAACSSDTTSTTEQVERTTLADSGADCVTGPGPEHELCFRYAEGKVTVTARGLQGGSRLTITGAGGADIGLDVVADEAIQTEVSGQVLEPPFTADGVWDNGQPAELTIDVAD